MCERVMMKKWPTLIKIGVWVFLCSFMIEYLDPSVIGVRAYGDLSLKHYSSFANNSTLLRKSNPLIWVNSNYDLFLENQSPLLDKPCIEGRNVAHAMIWYLPFPVNRVFPINKIQPVQKILSEQLSFEEIYHPPRRPFSFISV